MKKEYLECGKILGAHGVRGVIKVDPWCDSPKVLAAQKRIFFAEKDGSFKEAKVESASVSGPIVLIKLAGLDDREIVQGMKNTIFYLKREDIPLKPGAVLLADIIGIPVIDADSGAKYGTVTDVTDSVASRIYVIETDKGEVLFPHVKEFIEEINVEEGLFIRPIPGFFD